MPTPTHPKEEEEADEDRITPAVSKSGSIHITFSTATFAMKMPRAKLALVSHEIMYKDRPINDETYVTTMGVGSKNWYQTNDVHLDDHEFEVNENDEGIVDAPKGRAGNYTTDEDILLCNTWLQVSRDVGVGGGQSRDAYWIRMKEHFDLYNKSVNECTKRSLRSRWSIINTDCQKWTAVVKAVDTLNPSGTNDQDRDDEKWKPREGVDEESNKRKPTVDLDDDEEESSSDGGKRSPTPNSVAYSKPNRPSGGKKEGKEKRNRKGDDELKMLWKLL
ncbi:Alternative oxidase 1a, mitochondrial [Hordeum vulgare]|nr:Alternative oxidase 1a, mitochondrial [Hordeum vulgare]